MTEYLFLSDWPVDLDQLCLWPMEGDDGPLLQELLDDLSRLSFSLRRTGAVTRGHVHQLPEGSLRLEAAHRNLEERGAAGTPWQSSVPDFGRVDSGLLVIADPSQVRHRIIRPRFLQRAAGGS